MPEKEMTHDEYMYHFHGIPLPDTPTLEERVDALEIEKEKP
jgi:hypothetical protein